MPKVSVIVPVYGVEKYIERCARSLFEQTLDDIEFIFVDDCTPDNSMNVLSGIIEECRPRFAGKNWVVRTVRMPTNSGQAAVRRHGIQLATGEYVIHCDSDDWVDPFMYEKLYSKAVSDDSDIVLCRYVLSDGETFWDDPSFTQPYKNNKNDLIRQLLNWKISGSLWSKLVKRTIYTEDIEYPKDNMYEDVALSIQLLFFANKVSVIDEKLYFYFVNNNSICHKNSEKNVWQIVNNVRLVENVLKKFSIYIMYRTDLMVLKHRVLANARRLSWKDYINIYKRENVRLLFANKASFRDRIGHFLKMIGIYDYLRKY